MFLSTYEKVHPSVMPEKRSIPLGLGSAFAAIPPPPPVPLDQRHPDRFLWDPTPRLHPLHAPAPPSISHMYEVLSESFETDAVTPNSLLLPLRGARCFWPHTCLNSLGSTPSLDLPHLVGSGRLGAASELTAPQPTYRIPPYMEHLYQTLHTSPQASLRGISPLERSGLSIGSDYLGMSGLAATRLSDPHLLPGALTSTDLAFSLDGSRLTSPRPSLRQSRKRALSSSPYSDSFDINSMIRFSPNSLVSIMNGSRSPSTSGSYGHLSAGAISPALGMPPSMGSATTQLQQLQAHLMRTSIPGSPFLAPSPLLQHPPSSLAPQGLFSFSNHAPTTQISLKPESEKAKDITPLGGECPDEEKPKQKKDSGASAGATVAGTISRNGVAPIPTSAGGNTPQQGGETVPGGGAGDEDILKEEPDDFIETNCNWKDCDKEFNTQDDLVKHINTDHIHANKKSFVCRWKECSREEKPFKAQYMLVVHMRRHTGEKPHRCTFEGCFKAYSRLENLKTHLRSHTGEKPYMCEYPGCTKAFSNASDRAKHQNRTHSNEKPYVCKAPGCTKRYTDPSSLRKHVKTVHGADFYASKKHKGNDQQNGTNGGSGTGSKDAPGGNSDGSPNSEGGKGGSLSSPSVKSEDPTSPGQDHSPSMVVGGTTPMDQSRLMDGPISDNNVSTTGGYESLLRGDWEPEDDLEASIDLPISLASLNGPNCSVVSGVVGMPERNVRGKFKSRMQTKGLANILQNVPMGPRRSSNGSGVGELSQKITELKMSGQPSQQQTKKNGVETQYRNGQTALTNNRRDSNSTISTYYGSMRSDSSHPMSRRGSELSQGSCASVGGGRPSIAPPSLYDPISCGSSRRSSEHSTYNNVPSANHQAKFNRRGMVGQDGFNSPNLVIQTQNMSLSQESLHNQQWNSGMGCNFSGGMAMDPSNGGYFGCMGSMGPQMAQGRDTGRRASDPIKPLERGFSDPNRRMPRHHSYSNFNYRNQMGATGTKPPVTPPHYSHPNQGLQLDQVGEDEPIENKLILPDDMVNYLNQNGTSDLKFENKETHPLPPGTPNSIYNQQMASPAYSNTNLTSPAYANQNLNSPYPNQPSNIYQYPQASPCYSSHPSGHGSTHNMGYNQSLLSPGHVHQQSQQQHFNAVASTTPTPNYNQMANMYSHHQQSMGSCYPTHQQGHYNQYNQYGVNSQMMGQSHQQQQMYGSVMQNQQQRLPQNMCNSQNPMLYGLGSDSYGPMHVCGHLAPPNLTPMAYQSPCSGCQSRSASALSNDNSQYHQNASMNGWQMGSANFHYGSQYCGQPQIGVMGSQVGMGYQDSMTGHYINNIANGDMMSMSYQVSVSSDVQCGDVSQSSQSRSTSKTKSVKSKDTQEKTKSTTAAPPPPDPVDPVRKESSQRNIEPKLEDTKPADSKPIDTKADTKLGANNNYMKSDTYQRTLEYVQQCQSWNTSSVKEEVTSTTDQKPKLDPQGSVVGYEPQNVSTVTSNTVPATISQPPAATVPLPETPASVQSRLTTPLPPPLTETPNLSINDLTSLSTLQDESKYLQMLQ